MKTRRKIGPRRIPQSLRFKSLMCEFQSSAVFGHRANDVIRCTRRNLCSYLEGHRYLGANEASQMADHLFRDTTGITTNPSGIEVYGSMEALRLGGRRCRNSWTGIRYWSSRTRRFDWRLAW